MIKDWSTFNGLNVTINTTEDCNLRCKYCYEMYKKPGNINLETAKKFLDWIFDDSDPTGIAEEREDYNDGLVLDLIGGDALMNVDILDDIFKYVQYKWIMSDRFKLRGWRSSISSNGTLFINPKVREFCEKWKNHISLGVSIDGCPEIHDKNRIFCDGRGSMKTIMEWWPWYKKNFPINGRETKATCNRDSIPYLYESLKFMHEELGLRWIHQNFIAEDIGLTEEDLKLLDDQLALCCDYCIEHKDDLYWSMFGPNFQFPTNERITSAESWYKASCGAGQMPACSIKGEIWPCFRWLPQSQGDKTKKYCAGSLDKGINKEIFKSVREQATKENCTRDLKCRDCEYESACVWCVAGCFAEYSDFIRTTHLCEITKLQCKWAQKYLEKLRELENENC